MNRQRGAAVLLAMLILAVVATLSSAALWRQWQRVQAEGAERARAQSSWLLTGALDWARLVLREDARGASIDHLGELWAVPLEETRLTAFLATRQALGEAPADGLHQVFLSGEIHDLQARLNALNLAAMGRISEPAQRSFARLFAALGLPPQELSRLAESLRRASDIDPDSPQAASAPPVPQRTEHLVSMGLSPASLAVLEPHITVLSGRTAVNLNTASAEVIHSAMEGLSLAEARRLVAGRRASPLRSLDEARQRLGGQRALDAGQFSVASRYFEVRNRLRTGAMEVEDRAIVQRDGPEVVVVLRERGAVHAPAPPPALAARP